MGTCIKQKGLVLASFSQSGPSLHMVKQLMRKQQEETHAPVTTKGFKTGWCLHFSEALAAPASMQSSSRAPRPTQLCQQHVPVTSAERCSRVHTRVCA